MVEPGTPGSNTSDLSLPASERAFGGGEPTTSAAATEEAAAEESKKDSRGLLMKAFDVPEDAGWRIFGWIQNSYTGNTNGFGNGFNFGVNPNFKANSWMGNQYYLIFEKPLKQDDTVNFGFRIDNLFGNDWQFNYMQGLFNGAFRPGQFTGYDMAQLYGEVHLPVPHQGRPRRQGRPVVHAGRLRSGAGDRPTTPLGSLHVQLRPTVHPRGRGDHAPRHRQDQPVQRHDQRLGPLDRPAISSGVTSAASPGPPRTRRPAWPSPTSGARTSSPASCPETSRSIRPATSTSRRSPA